jgi:hypothetical protein
MLIAFYVAPDSRLFSAPLPLTVEPRTVDVGAPVALFTTHTVVGGANLAAAGVNARAQYAVSADGRFLLNTAAESAAPAPPITIVQTWDVALKR